MKKTHETYEHGDYWFELELEDGKWKVDVYCKDRKKAFSGSFVESLKGFVSSKSAFDYCNEYIKEKEKVSLKGLLADISQKTSFTYGDIFNLEVAIAEKVLDLEKQLKEVKNELES